MLVGCGSAEHAVSRTATQSAATTSAATSTAATSSVASTANGVATSAQIKACLQEAGYAVLDASQTSIPPSGAFGPEPSPTANADGAAFSDATYLDSATYEIMKSGTNATIGVYQSGSQAETAAAPNSGAAAAANFQPRSVGNVVYITWSGDPSNDIQTCTST